METKLFKCVTKLHQILFATRKDCFLFFHLFATCSQWVSISNPIFYEGITHYEGGKKRKEKNAAKGVGAREKHCGDQKVFNRHNCLAIKFGHHLVAPIKFGFH
jgi:hypothetical protein